MTWNERITKAEILGGFTFKDQALATAIDTCAVGEKLGLGRSGLHDARNEYNEYTELQELGDDFTDAVLNRNVRLAREILTKIQDFTIPTEKIPMEVEV